MEAITPPLSLVLLGTALVGLLVGSFLNVIIHRLPLMLHRQWQAQCAELAGEAHAEVAAQTPFNLVLPASHCPACGARVRVLHNLPVVSWLLLRGRCADCRASISARYPLVEALTAAASIAVVWHFGPGVAGLAALGFTWSLIAASVIDLEHQLLPDNITLPLLWAGLLLAVIGDGLFTDPVSSVLGAAAGYLALWSVFQLFRVLTGKEGMGYGDFKLLAALGAWLGWQMLPQIILISAIGGTLVGVLLMAAQRRGRDVPIPFGPYLAGAGWVALLWGESINRWYLGMLGV